MRAIVISIALFASVVAPCLADQVYQAPAEFLKEAFAGSPPAVAVLDITGERRARVAEILDHAPAMLRVRYWKKDQRSAWVLEEIGKVKPITTGIIVQNGEIEDVRILIYRESHGDEVRHEFFTKQFEGAALKENMQLGSNIDGISGATLSVNAIKRLARLALYLDQEARSL